MYTFLEALKRPVAEVGEEAHLLAENPEQPKGFVLAPRYEEVFYSSNNLPEQLSLIFKPINPKRIDEDLLETLCAKACTLVLDSYFLDDPIARIYLAFKNSGLLYQTIQVRRPSSTAHITAQLGSNGREGLLAIKKLWALDWEFEAVLQRLDDSSSIALAERATYILAAPTP